VTTPDVGASVNEWVNVVRRGRLGPTVKLVALTIATYANPDGTSIFPGIARLAVQCEVDYRTARRALAALRSMGLIELVKRGARKLGKSDEYRLILSASLLEHCEIPTPDAEKVAIRHLAERERAGSSQRRSTGQARPVETAASEPVYGSLVPCANGSTGQVPHFLQVTPTPPPSIGPVPVNQPSPDEAEDRSAGTGSAREAPPIPEPAADLKAAEYMRQAELERIRKIDLDQRLAKYIRDSGPSGTAVAACPHGRLYAEDGWTDCDHNCYRESEPIGALQTVPDDDWLSAQSEDGPWLRGMRGCSISGSAQTGRKDARGGSSTCSSPWPTSSTRTPAKALPRCWSSRKLRVRASAP
jgi:DNA-binding transcriptional ArsR family regulator